MKKILILLLMLTLTTVVWASNLILEIKINGEQNFDKELIKSVINFEVGENLTPEMASESIKNLYKLGGFKNIKIKKQNLKQGIEVIIDVEEYPKVNSITYENNDRFSNSTLDEKLNIRKSSFWSKTLEAENRRRIKKAYKEKGYFLADADFITTALPDNKVDLLISFKEGKKVRVRNINIIGNKKVSSGKLISKMKTRATSLFRSGKFEKEKFEEDLKKIVAYYNEEGYIDAHIISHEVNQTDKESLEIVINLFEGTQFLFGKVEVEGNTRFTDEKIIEKFKFKNKDVFDMDKFKRQMNAVSSLYYEEGYIYSRFEKELIKNDNVVDILIKVSENNRAKVRKIFIKGNRKTKEKIIRRQLRIHPGEYFRQSALLASQQNIYNLGFFEPNIQLDQPKIINENGDVDLTIKLSDKTSGTANGGIGYNSQDHLVGQLTVTHNNLFGNSWATSAKWEFGGSRQNFEFDFTNPYFLDSSTLLGFNIYHTRKEWDSYNYEVFTNGAGVRVGEPLSFLNYAKVYLGYSLYSKKYKIMNKNSSYSDNLAELDSLGWQYTSSVSLTFSRDSRNNIFFPTRGTMFSLYSELAGGPFMGDFDYFKQIGQFSWYMRLFWKVTLRSKWRMGYVTAYGSSDEVPPDERFYLGGTGSNGIRGYGDRSIGPNDGGHRMFIHSSEIAFPIVGEQITGLFFVDAGNCFDEFEEFNFWKMKKGAGTGIRVQSPFGIIGFDFAHNFETKKWEPHFQFGTTF